MTECLGHEVWLREAASDGQLGFELVFETTMSPRDHFDAHFSDLSDWLAKHLQTIEDIDSRPMPQTKLNKANKPGDATGDKPTS
jgi:hypothetical protein